MANPKRNALNGNDAVAGPSNHQSSSQQNIPYQNGSIQVIDDSDLESSPTSSRCNSPSPAPTPDTVQRYSSEYSDITDTTINGPNRLQLHSVEMGRDAFKHILSNVDLKKFMSENWEKHPLYIDRPDAKHYDHLNVSRQTIDEMLRNNPIEYTKNLDITMYENGVRQTYNPGKSREVVILSPFDSIK